MPHAPMHRQRRGRNVALALFLVGLCVLFFAMTIVKMRGGA